MKIVLKIIRFAKIRLFPTRHYVKLDLTNTHDRAELQLLLADADILLTNFKYGGAAKFNLDFKTLQEVFPKLIVGQISGFKSAPKRTAFDVVVQAETGWMQTLPRRWNRRF